MNETVHVVDDDAAMRDSLALLLGAGGFSVRTHDGAAAFLAQAESASGCVLTDLNMPDIDGLALQRHLVDRGLPLPVIVMTGAGDVAHAVRAMKNGAVDFLEKPFSDDALFDAVRRALARSERRRAGRAAKALIATLTPREHEVLVHLVEGQPTKAIAHLLGASPRTIEVHRARVMEKLGARGLPDLVRLTLAASPDQG